MQYRGLKMLFEPVGETGSNIATMYKALMPKNEQNFSCKHIRHLNCITCTVYIFLTTILYIHASGYKSSVLYLCHYHFRKSISIKAIVTHYSYYDTL